MATTVPPRLPKTANDGAEVCDVHGNVWRYSSYSNAWIFSGTLGDPPVVTEKIDGLVTPEIYNHIQYIRSQIVGGLSFDILKVYPALNSFWYYLRSNNKTIKFTQESESKLRIEVDRGFLAKLLSMNKCPGPIGEKGHQGPAGKDGKPGPKEVEHTPTINGSTMLINSEVVADIDTPISLRLFASTNKDKPAAILLIPLDDTDPSITTFDAFDFDEILIDENQTAISFDELNGTITGEVVIDRPWEDVVSDKWTYKVGQTGRKGPRGNDGFGFLEIIPNTFNDINLRSTEAMISLRQGAIHGDLFGFSAPLFDKNCVDKIGLRTDCEVRGFPFRKKRTMTILAIKKTTDECKDTTRFIFGSTDDIDQDNADRGDKSPVVCCCPDTEQPILILPEWTPVEACWQQRHWPISQFNWVGGTATTPPSHLQWPRAGSSLGGNPAYPYTILHEGAPGTRCCQDDFFFCTNINDELCPITGTPIQPPLQPPTCCECDCPIALDIADGYDFKVFGVDSDGVVIVGDAPVDETPAYQTAVCTLEGIEHQYRQRVTIWDQNETINVFTLFWVEYDDLCDEARQAYFDDLENSHIPSFSLDCGDAILEEDCPFEISVRDVSIQVPPPVGLLPVERIGPDFQIGGVGDILEFEHQGQVGHIDFDIRINPTLQDCCLAYRITSCIDLVPRTPIQPPEPSPSVSPSPSPLAVSPSPSPSPSPLPSPTVDILFGGITPAAIECGALDVAFLIDNSSSMETTIDSVKLQVDEYLDVIESASLGDYRLSLVSFKDSVTVEVPFASGNREAIELAMDLLTSSGGGGTPEASDTAVQSVVDGGAGSWRDDVGKVIILITNAPPGGTDDTFTVGVDDVNAHNAALDAQADDIHIGAILTQTDVGDFDADADAVMQDYAVTTNGGFAATAPADAAEVIIALLEAFCANDLEAPVSEYNIELNIDPVFTESQAQVFRDAADTWATMIIGDLPDVVVPGVGLIDDIRIDINELVPGDGPGGVLGSAGPTVIRSGSLLPALGEINLDPSDVATLEANGELLEVALHEMGHVLGFGSLWQLMGLIVDAGGSDPRYIGAAGVAEYNSVFGVSEIGVPVENTGGPGTADVHWRETDFDTELMTGFLDADAINPLSRVSIGAMQDMGYMVNLSAAEDYDPFAPMMAVLAKAKKRTCCMWKTLPIQVIEVPDEAVWASEHTNRKLLRK